jgi:hypothetical protein
VAVETGALIEKAIAILKTLRERRGIVGVRVNDLEPVERGGEQKRKQRGSYLGWGRGGAVVPPTLAYDSSTFTTLPSLKRTKVILPGGSP